MNKFKDIKMLHLWFFYCSFFIVSNDHWHDMFGQLTCGQYLEPSVEQCGKENKDQAYTTNSYSF